MRQCEIRELVLLGREPPSLAVGQHGIEDHQAFDRARQRGGSSMPIIGLAYGTVERLVVDVEDARAMVAARPRGRIATRHETVEELAHLATVRDSSERAILPADADA